MPPGTLNFNIGVLGHVDSGKTSLCKALSTTASTAAFDKNPQSKERGITLDLGFSSFTVCVAEEKRGEFGGCDSVQYTLVDCPGHASLIRTIIGGGNLSDLHLECLHSLISISAPNSYTEGGPKIQFDVILLSGISELSFHSPFLSPLSLLFFMPKPLTISVWSFFCKRSILKKSLGVINTKSFC